MRTRWRKQEPDIAERTTAVRPEQLEAVVDFDPLPVFEPEVAQNALLVLGLVETPMPGYRSVAGIGSGYPRRRAAATAAASSHEDSRPPENETRQRFDASAGSRMWFSVSSRSTSRATRGSGSRTS